MWLEDPLKEPRVEAYKHLYKKIITPIAIGDLSPSLDSQSILQYLNSECCNIVKPDIAYKGGLTGSRLMAEMAIEHGLECDIHHAGNPLLNIATLHLSCSLDNLSFYEWIIPDSLHNYGVVDYPKPDASGIINCPNGPGLGVELDIKALTKNLIKSFTV